MIENKLSQLVVDHHMFMVKTLNFHWNVKGKHFFPLHEKFEEYYKETLESIDELAEQLFALGFTFELDMADAIAKTTIKSFDSEYDDEKIVKELIGDFQNLKSQSVSLAIQADKEDQRGLANILDDIISDFDSKLWMLESFLR